MEKGKNYSHTQSYLAIVLDILPASQETARFTAEIPIELLYTGFKISYLCPERLEDEMLVLLRRHYSEYSKNSWGSLTLEELLLSIENERIEISEPGLELLVCRHEF